MRVTRILSIIALVLSLLLCFTSCDFEGLLSGEITLDEFISGSEESKSPHEHTYATEYSKNDTHHWLAATCEHTDEKKDFTEHTYANGSCICGKNAPDAPADPETPEEPETPAHTHTFAKSYSRDADNHWFSATCEHIFEKSGVEPHSYENGVCICGKTDPSAPPAHTHTFAEEYSKDADKHWFSATCEHTTEKSGEAEHTYVSGVCVCGQAEPTPPAHTHTFATEYSKNDTHHWFAATCEHTTEKSGEAAHTYESGVCVCGKVDPNPSTDEDNTEYPADGEYRHAIDSYIPLANIPAFEGSNYTVLNGNKPYFLNADKSKIAYAYYSQLDSLGRAGLAVACLGPELLPTGNRKDPTHNPTGWIQASYSGDIVSGGAIWNRSHLIAWSLADDSSKENLVTGTPFFNQRGMTIFEDMVRDYIKETGNHVLYRVVPVFIGNELVCRGVTMEAFSLEDNGGTNDAETSDGLYFNVFIHNVNPGIIIDYATGRTSVDPNYDDGKEDVVEPSDVTYVVNKSNYKIHEADCSSVTAMSEKNKLYYTCTYDELIALLNSQGKNHSNCGSCHPEQE